MPALPPDPRDYKLDLTSLPPPSAPAAPPARASASHRPARPYLSVHFACCNIYLRLYPTPGRNEYAGRCPACGKAVKFPIAAGGTDVRTFRVE